MRRAVVGLGAGVLASIAIAVPAVGGSSTSELVDSYASPTGDFSTSIVIRGQRVKFEIATFSFRGRYELCVKREQPRRKQCEEFRLERFGDFWTDRVDWARHFKDDFGRYKVVWKLDGQRLGEALRFEVEGPVSS